jgi:coenzyme F420-reducing hydrogenase alpha subunit
VKNGIVEDVKLQISENKRFYTQAVRGKPIAGVHQLVSRICGTCSIAHLTACISAVENAANITPSDQTMVLRRLSMHGLMIRDHALHLFFFSLPDLLGVDSVLDFTHEQEHLLEKAFKVKSSGNELSKLVAGRSVHAPFPMVGGFAKVPEKEKAKEVVSKLKGVRETAIELVELFNEDSLKFERCDRFVALSGSDFDYLSGELTSTTGVCIPKVNYLEHLHRVIIPYSQATGFEFQGKDYVVGALARLNLNKGRLHKATRDSCQSMLSQFPSNNIFRNNLAQGLELIHSIDSAIELLETTEFKPESPVKIGETKETGTAAIEAPRGVLFYSLGVKDAKVQSAELVIPTAQNQVTMENDIRKLVQENLELDKEEIRRKIEYLIRAYDPCMSCATHFLKIKWIGR